MPRFARLAFAAIALLAGLFLTTSPGCDKGPARECDGRFECGPGLVCDLGSNQCIEPNQSNACGGKCTGATPFCYAEAATCVGCLDQGGNDECASDWICEQRSCVPCDTDTACIGNSAAESTVCLRNGGCADQPDVAYVSAGGTANAECSFATPCNSLASALATGRAYLRLQGDFTVSAPLMISRSVSIYGERNGGTTITRSGAGALFEVSGTGTVELSNLALTGATGATGHAISITGGAPKLDLYRVDLIGNGGAGITGPAATLRVTGSLLVNNAQGGIATSATVVLENNFFVGNGGATSNGGAIDLSSTDATNAIRFNTFASNQGTLKAVRCGAAAVKLSSNIFSGAAPQVGTCTTTHSLFSVTPATLGTNDIVGDPQFTDLTLPTRRDRDTMKYYLIPQASPAADAAENLVVDADFFGDPRSAPRDIGADEFYQ
jgi:hypothetical protein